MVIIDTDPGLDDAVAILFALACERFDIVGITTVAGNIGLQKTTRNAGSLLQLLNKTDLRVIPGAAGPLARPAIDEARIHGDDGLGGVSLPPPSQAALGYAPQWMAEELMARLPGTIDILALGPLTNIAVLLRDFPQTATRIGRIIAMGGVLRDRGNVGPHSEFNLAVDPEAADIVLRSGVPLVLVPLDVTRQVRADADYLDRLRSGSLAGRTAANFLAAYFAEGRHSRPLHDPCVMLYALAPALFGAEEHRLSVDLSEGQGAGTLLPDASANLITVLTSVDTPEALDLLAAGLA